jgi:hypothetical protein
LPAVTFSKVSGSGNLSVDPNTGAITAAIAIPTETTQSLVGRATGSDGCIIPFTYNLTGFTQMSAPINSTSSSRYMVTLFNNDF